MNLGARAATGTWLCFLHADSMPGASEEELQRVLGSAEWGFCRVRLSGSAAVFRVIEWFMNQRSRLTGVATGDQMLIVRRETFEAEAGFADIPLMEDVELCKRLRRRSRPVVIRSPVETSSRRWETRGVVSTVVQMWSLRLAYVMGVSPQTLWRRYYGA